MPKTGKLCCPGLTPATEQALALLKKHQAFFDWAVAELLAEDGVITDGTAREKFGELYG